MKKRKNDIILIVALFAVSLCFLFGLFLMKQGTKEPEAVIRVNGIVYGRYPLAKDREIPIPGNIGTNVLTIKDGTAYMSSAVCPDKICRNIHGKIRYQGEQIVCIPGGIVVMIENGEVSELDAIVH